MSKKDYVNLFLGLLGGKTPFQAFEKNGIHGETSSKFGKNPLWKTRWKM